MAGMVTPGLGSDCPSPLHRRQLLCREQQPHLSELLLGDVAPRSPYKQVGDSRSSPGPLAQEPQLILTTG